MGSNDSSLFLACIQAYRILRHEGFRALAVNLLAHSIYRRVRFFELEIRSEQLEALAHRHLSIDFLRSENIDEYLKLRPQAGHDEVLERFRKGHECVIIRAMEQPVHTCWIGQGRVWVAYLSVWLEMKSDQIYVYDSYTAPAWRGQNLPFVRRQFLLRHLFNAGYGKLVAVAVPENKPAIRAIFKGGYKETGTLACIRIMRWRFPVYVSRRVIPKNAEDAGAHR